MVGRTIRMGRGTAAVCILVGLAITGLMVKQVQAKLLDRIVALVNSEPILLSEVDALCQFALGQVSAELALDQSKSQKRKIRLETLEGLIDERLIQQQIRERQIVIKDEEVEAYIEQVRKSNNLTEEQFKVALQQEGKTQENYMQMLRATMEKRALLRRELQGKAVVSEKDIAQYYQTHYQTGGAAEKVKASHVLFAIPPDTPAEKEKAVHERAKATLAALRAGADFAATAKEHSDDPSAAMGGDLGWFRRGDMVAAFEKSVFGLKKGEMSDLVRTRFGYHIILLTGRGTDDPPKLDEVSDEIRARLSKDMERRLMRNWLQDLRRRSYVDIKL